MDIPERCQYFNHMLEGEGKDVYGRDGKGGVVEQGGSTQVPGIGEERQGRRRCGRRKREKRSRNWCERRDVGGDMKKGER